MWSYVNEHAAEFFTNPFYLAPAPGQPFPRLARIPTTNYFELTVWKDLFLRYSWENPRYQPKVLTGQVVPGETYREQVMRE
jgi:hypothetical protein